MSEGIPSYLVTLLRRYPLVAADLLTLLNYCRRLRQDVRTLAALSLALLVGVALLAFTFRQFDGWLRGALQWLVAHELWAGALAALYGYVEVARRRVQSEQRHALSWLAAAAALPGTPRSALLLRTLWPLGLQLFIVVAGTTGLGLWYESAPAVGLLTGWIFGGSGLGAGVGWWRGGRQLAVRSRYEDSRYLPQRRNRNPQHRPSLAALSHLPVARALAWYRPENSRVFVLLVIATMPAGTSMQSGACALLVALLIAYAGALLRAVMLTGSEAARWLEATPLRFLAFAWPLVRRAVLHQVVVSLGVAASLLPLGATLAAVSYLVVLWLTVVSLSWCLWLQGSFHGERPFLKVVGSVATTLGLEQLARGMGIVTALLWTCWNLRARPS